MRPLVTDRALPPVPGIPLDAFESLYAQRRQIETVVNARARIARCVS
jgi:hypothetical protein